MVSLKQELKHHQKLLVFLISISVFFFIFVFVVTSLYIGKAVKRECQSAQARYQGNCVSALIKVLENPQSGFIKRNYAIWALGQLGDKKALPVLKSYYTGEIPAKEPYNIGISQHELKKAINLIENNSNISAIIWRR